MYRQNDQTELFYIGREIEQQSKVRTNWTDLVCDSVLDSIRAVDEDRRLVCRDNDVLFQRNRDSIQVLLSQQPTKYLRKLKRNKHI